MSCITSCQTSYGLRILGNYKILGKSQNFIEWEPSANTFCQNGKFVNTSKKLVEKQKLNFSRSALFHMKTRDKLKYFVNDCLWKKIFCF